ncbi:MAG: polymer-forming cytoskeletal protein [Spirochaetota bacterium]
MSDHFATDGSFINSIVGEGTKFRGELELNGLLRIDGDFSGTITTTGKVLVGKNGRAECTIKAGTVVVGGIVKGNIFSRQKVIVLSTGMIIGNVSAPRLIVEEGVVLDGSCSVSNNESHTNTIIEETRREDIHNIDDVKQFKASTSGQNRKIVDKKNESGNPGVSQNSEKVQDFHAPSPEGPKEVSTQYADPSFSPSKGATQYADPSFSPSKGTTWKG